MLVLGGYHVLFTGKPSLPHTSSPYTTRHMRYYI
jgi:hypothetical protein